MALTTIELARLKKNASFQPASDAALLWFLVWILVTCVLLWFYAAQAFPKYDGAQGVSLPWVGALITAGGLIAAVCCYFCYISLSGRKDIAIRKLKEQNLMTDPAISSSAVGVMDVKGAILTLVVAMAGLGIVVYLVQSFV